jgi:hypothetical protein
MVGMKLKTITGEAEIDESEVLRAAGVICAGRRKVFRGPPKKTFTCGWCGGKCSGRRALAAHMGMCAKAVGNLWNLPDVRSLRG